jgi:acyl carrier protein
MSTPTVTFDAIAEHIAQVLQVPREQLKPDVLISDLGTDSLDLVEMAIDLQEEFDVIMTPPDFAAARTPGDLATLLHARQCPACRASPPAGPARTRSAVSSEWSRPRSPSRP